MSELFYALIGVSVVLFAFQKPLENAMTRGVHGGVRSGVAQAVKQQGQELWEEYVPFVIRQPGTAVKQFGSNIANFMWNAPKHLASWIGEYDD